MNHEVPITFRNMGPSQAMQATAKEEAEHLWDLSSRMLQRCRILIEAPHRHHHKGVPYRVRVELGIPRSRGVVVQQQHEDPYVAIRDTFAAARKIILERFRRRRSIARHRKESFKPAFAA